MSSFLERLKENKDKNGPDLSAERAKELEVSPGLEKEIPPGFKFEPIAAGAVPEDLGAPVQIKKIEPDAKKAEAALAVYQATRVQSIAMRLGRVLQSDNGFFYCKDEEEVAMLEDYASRKYVMKIEKKVD